MLKGNELVLCHCGSGRKRGWWKPHCAACEPRRLAGSGKDGVAMSGKRKRRKQWRAERQRQQRAKQKSDRVVVTGQGDPCPRCGQPMQIREHAQISKKHRRQPFYYARWFRCMNDACQTTLVMPDRYRVWNCNDEDRANLEHWLGKQKEQRRTERETERQVAAGELVLWGDSWPDDGDTSGPPPWE
jgi:hypothetical protein